MQRIVIIGCSSSGKSTLARELGRRLGLPVTHLDALYWQPGWRPPPERAAFDAKVVGIAAGEKWIIDGGYSSTLTQRLARADLIIVMNFPRWMCLWRVCKRAVRYRGHSRPDMGPACPEKVDFEFLRYIWSYRAKVLQRYEKDYLAGYSRRIVRLNRPGDVESFLAGIPDRSSG